MSQLDSQPQILAYAHPGDPAGSAAVARPASVAASMAGCWR
jgi:hypothetical protein